MKPLVSMRDALSDPDLFGKMLAGDSWAPWRVLLIASMGETLDDDERAIFLRLTGRANEPPTRVDELYGIIGRRGGKTRAAAVLAAYLAALVDIECRPASFRTVRGSTFVAAIADEVAFWRSDETSRNPDAAILAAARPALSTTQGPLIVISSPYAQAGELFRAYKRDYGPDGDPLVLVAKAPSRVMNPTLSQKVIDRAYERDAASARAEYDAEFRNDVSGFIDADTIEAAVERGLAVRPPASGVTYVGFADPSGGSGSDSFTAAVAHAEGERVILDCVLERKPPLSPASVVEEFSSVFKSYRISRIRSDRYAGDWPTEAWARHGIFCEPADMNRSEIYLAFLPLLNSGRVSLVDNQRMIGQFVGLERRTSRVGRDIVDAAPGAHEDLANSTAGAIVMACGGVEPGFLVYMRQQSDALMRGDFALAHQPKKMRMRAPADISAVQVLSGRTYAVPESRILELDEEDAKPLFRVGFTLEKENA